MAPKIPAGAAYFGTALMPCFGLLAYYLNYKDDEAVMKQIDTHYSEEVKLARYNNKEMQKIFTGLASGDPTQIEKVDTILKGKLDPRAPIPTNAQRAVRRPNHLAQDPVVAIGTKKNRVVKKNKVEAVKEVPHALSSEEKYIREVDGTAAIVAITAASAAGVAALLTAAFLSARPSH